MNGRGMLQTRRGRRIALATALVAVVALVAGIWITSGARNSPGQAGAGAGTATGSSSGPVGSSPGGSSISSADPAQPGQGATVLPAGLRLAAGHAQQAPTPVPVVPGEPLNPSQLDAVLQRLTAWTPGASLGTPFRWPTQTTPAPQAGKTETIPFPGPGSTAGAPTTPAQPSGPLHVVRAQPQGPVAIAPFLSITFDQPMVPVATVGRLATSAAPAVIKPAVPGNWEWIGTNTVRFAAKSDKVDRLPMATQYTVTVPAGTRSATGGRLAQPAVFTFRTPAPTVQHFAPTGDSMSRHPVFVAVFDQLVDPQAVLDKVTVTAGGQSVPVRVATAAEIAADAKAAAAVKAVPSGRAVAFRSAEDLPTAAAISVTFPAGTPSAEGPLTTTAAKSFTGRTYEALALTTSSCYLGNRCEPGAQLALQFNNNLARAAFDPATIRVSPEIPGGAAVSVSENYLVVAGATQPSTSYTVTVPAGLTDVFGQKLHAAVSGTVKIGPAAPRLDQFPQPVTTLDPMVGTPSVPVNTVNRTEFRERVFAVSPADWAAYQKFYMDGVQKWYRDSAPLDPPAWPVLTDRTVTVGGPKDRLVSTKLDLSQAISSATGKRHAVVLVEPTTADSSDDRYQNAPTMTWVQATTIGLDVLNDTTRLRAWATDLRDGSPLSGVTVGFPDGKGGVDPDRRAVTGADGLAAMDLNGTGTRVLLATKGDQTALLPAGMWGERWQAQPARDRLLWFVNDDRQTYRPGEKVSVKGWVRRQDPGLSAALAPVSAGSTVIYSTNDAYGRSLGHGKATVSRLGGFDFTLTVPAGANLGEAWLQLTLSGTSGLEDAAFSHVFQIADFRTPAFEVDTHHESSAPAVAGDDLTVAADASYYAGGPLGDAAVQWQVRTATATYAPPGWDRYTFGIWTPWWLESAGSDDGYAGKYGNGDYSGPCCGPEQPESTVTKTFAGTTDGAGSDYLQVQVGNLGPDSAGLPVTVTAQATVTDVNRQAIAGTADLLVHPASYYVGLAGDQTFVTQGQDLSVQAIATDIDGAARAGLPITVRAGRLTTTTVNGEPVETEEDVHTCRVTSGTGPVTCTFTPSVAGSYRITGTVADAKGRTSRSQLTRWVAGPDTATDTTVAQQDLTLIPDKKEYRPGESANLLVLSPVRSGNGLLTITHNGIASTARFAVANGSAVVPVPVTEADLPGVTASIEVVGTAPRTAAQGGSSTPRPAYATGEIGLTVSTASRSLTVTAVPRERTVAPGGSTKLDVTVKDADGKPAAGAEFEVVVADEAVLALGGYQLPDPLQAFYPELNNQLQAVYGRSLVALSDPDPAKPNQGSGGMTASAASSAAAAASQSESGGASSADSAAVPSARTANGSSSSTSGQKSAGTPIAERTNFDPLALFVPAVSTDAAGKATVTVPLPDNLTRYRVMLVAVAGTDRFGSAESTITAGLPLTVRPTAPRFLNFGDTLQLPVLLQNQTGTALTTDVLLQAANLAVTGGTRNASLAGKRVTVPAHGRIEVAFAVSAQQAGTARFRVAAVSDDAPGAADAAVVELPVYTPATTETFASYGTLDGGGTVRQPVTAPTGVISQFGGLQISTSSTALAELTDAVDYLADYDNDSSDALAGQIIAIGSLGDVLRAFQVPGLPSEQALKALVAGDVKKLTAMQNSDGGFPYWERGDKSDPFNSIQATQALLVAKERGFAVDQGTLNRADGYLRRIDAYIPADASQATRDTLRAYALNVRMLGGHRDAAGAAELATTRGTALPLDAVAWLLPVVTDGEVRANLLRRVGNAAVDDAGSASFTNAVTDDAWTTLQSDRRTDGLILDALLTVDPDSDLTGKIVAGLMSARIGGRWANVQENAFILLALRHYYDTVEGATPDFVAQIWLGDKFVGQHEYQGRTTERAAAAIPTKELLSASDVDVTLRNTGTGKLYYRLGLQTAPTSLSLSPLDHGFVVARSYQPVDDPGDVTRDADGAWHIKAGARVRVKLELVSRSAQSHVSLIDPLPAGLEMLNPELATTPKDLDPKKAAAAAGSTFPAWYWTWYDHQNLRDDRAEAFASWLQGGVYDYSYLAKATTDGTFVAPPTRAEQVYAPETFGRGGTDRVVIGG